MYFYEGGFKKVDTANADPEVDTVPKIFRNRNPTSLMARLKAKHCEWCGAENVGIEIHHVRRLKDLKGKKR